MLQVYNWLQAVSLGVRYNWLSLRPWARELAFGLVSTASSGNHEL